MSPLIAGAEHIAQARQLNDGSPTLPWSSFGDFFKSRLYDRRLVNRPAGGIHSLRNTIGGTRSPLSDGVDRVPRCYARVISMVWAYRGHRECCPVAICHMDGQVSVCALSTTHYERSTLCSRSYLRAIIGLFIAPRRGNLFPDHDAMEHTLGA